MSDMLPAEGILPSRPHQVEWRAQGKLRILAPAKINLNLLVGPRRDDGFHEIDSLAARVSLYDRLDMSLRTDGRLVLSCQGADCGPSRENLALQAAEALAARGGGRGVDILLQKRIPVGAGLGGGSSDAAAVLRGLNILWRLDMSDHQLAEVSASLGSDVPFFFGRSAARMTGRGEKLQPVTVHPFAAILAMPEFRCNTRHVYQAFDQLPQRRGEQLELRSLEFPPSQWRDRLSNQLSDAAEIVAPKLGDLRNDLTDQLHLPVCLSGSGSAVFVLLDSADQTRQALLRIAPVLRNRCRAVQSNPW